VPLVYSIIAGEEEKSLTGAGAGRTSDFVSFVEKYSIT